MRPARGLAISAGQGKAAQDQLAWLYALSVELAGLHELPIVTPGSPVKVDSRMDLGEAHGGTTMACRAEVVVHETIASVGGRLLSGLADKQTQRFFDGLRTRLAEEPQPGLSGPIEMHSGGATARRRAVAPPLRGSQV